MSRRTRQQWWCIVLEVVLGAVFLYAGAVKMWAPQEFADSVATFQVLPAAAIGLVALWLPVLEVILGSLLVLGIFKRPAALGSLLLLAIFSLALGQALLRGLPVDCGCFGGGEPAAWKAWLSLGRDVVLLAGASVLYWETLKQRPAE